MDLIGFVQNTKNNNVIKLRTSQIICFPQIYYSFWLEVRPCSRTDVEIIFQIFTNYSLIRSLFNKTQSTTINLKPLIFIFIYQTTELPSQQVCAS